MPTPLSWYTEAAAILRRERTKMTDEPTDLPVDQAEPRTAAGRQPNPDAVRLRPWMQDDCGCTVNGNECYLTDEGNGFCRHCTAHRAEAATPAVDVEADIRRATVERMENEGVVTWGDEGHRARFMAWLDEEAAR